MVYMKMLQIELNHQLNLFGVNQRTLVELSKSLIASECLQMVKSKKKLQQIYNTLTLLSQILIKAMSTPSSFKLTTFLATVHLLSP